MNIEHIKNFFVSIVKTILLLTMVLLVISFRGKLNPPDESKKIKVISYNIWNGFDWGQDKQRQENMVSWVNSQKPDVLALQELCGYTLEKLREDAKKWGHSYAEILKTTGYPVGITSNQPIEIKERILDNMHHGVLHCKISGIDFIVVHFSPFSFEKRREETKIVLGKLAEIAQSQDKYVVLGDFNAVSPFDADLYKDKPDLLKSLRESEVEHDHVRNLFHDQLEFGVLSEFLSFPLIDVTQKYTSGWDERVSCPTQVFEEQSGQGRNDNSKRIDYILTSPFIADHCYSAQVLNKEATYYLSDHYPVMAEFEF
ncbi:endonuclease/exonuclease/phosphatase family protein [Reichenbachiella sp. MALMAid0571]|uniref:endonuclease/exonuclease/phosphatase family protein n=1 Tax=Reichenbachiella sp. MALMAid0571 TaxID=3143939 RepID=UPI0032DF4E2E